MKRKNNSHRIIATFFLLIFFPTVFPVNLLYASNNGPTAPEAASFEPVDAADMVNLVTGDMSYVMPVINVPSPEGGYPLSLAYHAGIALEQEASWVGLGWNLNPGALNRSTSGVPDDWYQSKIHQIIYNMGGESTSYGGSVSIGWHDNLYSVGVYAAYSENKTFGGSTSYRTDGGVMGSVGPFGGRLGTNGVGLSFDVMRAVTMQATNADTGETTSIPTGEKKNLFSVGVDASFRDGSVSASIKKSFLEYSISTRPGQGGSASSFAGINLSGNQSFSGGLSANASVYSITIPLKAVNIGLNYRKDRYWVYENIHTKYDGALYSGDLKNFIDGSVLPNTIAFDSYNSTYKIDPENQLEDNTLSFAAYDKYWVSGQGISGNIKPYIFESGTLVNNRIQSSGSSDLSVSYQNGTVSNSFTRTVDNTNPNKDIHFYFENEYSSYLKYDPGYWNSSTINNNTFSKLSEIMPINPQFVSNTVIDGITYNGYNSSKNRKRTGSYIEVFTNKEIIENPSLIISPQNYTTANRSTAPLKGIGAFRVVALDGKTYHYSVPVYQKEMFTKSTPKDKEFEHQYFEQQQKEAYATHWLLTAITGPDYVDKNNNNKVDEADYGYWVDFEYGKWSDGFMWRTPGVGAKVNDKVKSYQWGVKEVYYLDKVKTRTHTAFFIKDLRADNLSSEMNISNNGGLLWQRDVNRSLIKGDDGQWYFNGVYDDLPPIPFNADPWYTIAETFHGVKMTANKHRSLKLSRILLLKNEDAGMIPRTNGYAQASNAQVNIQLTEKYSYFYANGQTLASGQSPLYSKTYNGELYNNVYDSKDLIGLNLTSVLQKAIGFEYDDYNPLAKNSDNSAANYKGRLTLKKVHSFGKNNAKLIPPYEFKYNNTYPYVSENEDNWGYHSLDPAQWSLNTIITPTGSEINVVYEEDDIASEAVSGPRVFDRDLQFKFSDMGNGKLQIMVQNETGSGNTVNFNDYFDVNINTKADIWACFKHDYWDGGCESRIGRVDINNNNIDIVSVSNSHVTLEVNLASSSSDSNGGRSSLFNNSPIGLEHHPGMIREGKNRGECANPPGCINSTDRLVFMYTLHSNKTALTLADKNGGGLRVKEIAVKGDDTEVYRTKYHYNVPGFGENKTDSNYKSSGITSYVPQKFFKEIKYVSELPQPLVTYEYVTVKTYGGNNLDVSERYNFEVLKPMITDAYNNFSLPGALDIELVENGTGNKTIGGENYAELNFSTYNIADATSSVGRLKSKTIYNSVGQVISNTSNTYKDNTTLQQGITKESFLTYKKTKKNNVIKGYMSIASKTKYPSVLASTSNFAAGYTNTTYFDKHDFLTGGVLETRTSASDGKTLKQRSVPAFYKYPDMGPKVDNPAYKNMMNQEAVTYSYLLNSDTGVWQETGVGLTTWNNNWSYKADNGDYITPTAPKEKIWRKHNSFIWQGSKDIEGIFMNYNGATDDGFNWVVGASSQPVQWKKVSEITLYDNYSMPLEAKDINGNFTATKMGDRDSKILATGNAGFSEMYYTGAEYLKDGWLEKEISLIGGAARSTIYKHTGKYCIETTSSSGLRIAMKSGQHRSGRFRLSVWVHKINASKARVKIGNTMYDFNPNESYTAGDWVLKTYYVSDVPTGDFTLSVCSVDGSKVYYDDLRLHPVASAMISYVYNNRDELINIIGSNGLSTSYIYDEAGRLIETYVEVIDDPNNGVTGGFKKSSGTKYHYKNL